MTDDKPTPLNAAQLARVAALSAARDALTTRGLASSSGPDVFSLLTTAHYVVTGETPEFDQ